MTNSCMDQMMPRITPRMAMAGREKLEELGYEDVEFTDAQEVFMAMMSARVKPVK